jgi:hypothetical protein
MTPAARARGYAVAMSSQTFLVAAAGDRLLSAKDGRTLERALKEDLGQGAPRHLVVDLAGVVQARSIVFHHLLRTARKLLQPHYPEGTVHVTNASKRVLQVFERTVDERHDFLREESTEGLRLRVSHPAVVVDELGERRIGTRRRQMIAVIARDGSQCVWCGLELSYHHPKATLDHVRPQSKSGSDKIANLLLSCDDCNYARKNRSAGQWLNICLRAGKQVNVAAVEAARRRARRQRATRRQPAPEPQLA